MPVAEEHVATREHERAVFSSGQINLASARKTFPIGHDFSKNSQPRHSAVRENPEAQERDTPLALNRNRILLISL
jgi:hypothetical protein